MIGDKISRLRQKKGYSISELAKLSNVSKSYVSHIERGLQTNPSLHFLYKIADTLETSIDYLVQENGRSLAMNPEIDEEWINLILGAIKEGVSKEDFRDFCDYRKYENWKKEQKTVE